jgi:5'-nucleotidase
MPNILLSNDDGYKSSGLMALKSEIEKLGDVKVFAPTSERSWIGKMISRYGEINVNSVKFANKFIAYSVSGSPSDSCLIGTANIIKETGKKPDLVISGINTGANMGLSFILSSGTIAVSMEAAMMDIPSFSVSLFFQKRDFIPEVITKIETYQKAAEFGRIIAEKILEKGKYPEGIDFLVINVPYNVTDLNYEITTVARIHYGNLFKKIEESKYIFNENISFKNISKDIGEDSDVYTIINKNMISITPITLDITGDLKKLKKYLD